MVGSVWNLYFWYSSQLAWLEKKNLFVSENQNASASFLTRPCSKVSALCLSRQTQRAIFRLKGYETRQEPDCLVLESNCGTDKQSQLSATGLPTLTILCIILKASENENYFPKLEVSLSLSLYLKGGCWCCVFQSAVLYISLKFRSWWDKAICPY